MSRSGVLKLVLCKHKKVKKITSMTALLVGLLLNSVSASELASVSELLLETPFGAKHIKQVLAGEIAATLVVPVSATEVALGIACFIRTKA